jgi:hypothetical protein
MSIHQVLLWLYALAVLLAVLLVIGRLGRTAIQAMRADKFRVSMLAVAGIACVVVLLASLLAWWFLLGVSHRHKDVSDTYTVMLGTGIPFFLASFGLWRLAAVLHSRIVPGAAERPIPAAAGTPTRRPSRAIAILLAAIVFCVAVPVIAVVLWLPVALLAGPGSSLLPWPLKVVVWLAAIAAVFGGPAWLARYVYRLWWPSAGHER